MKHKEIKIGPSEVKISEFKKWLRRLRSGKYEQSKGKLQSLEGFCCLGVEVVGE